MRLTRLVRAHAPLGVGAPLVQTTSRISPSKPLRTGKEPLSLLGVGALAPTLKPLRKRALACLRRQAPEEGPWFSRLIQCLLPDRLFLSFSSPRLCVSAR